MEKPDLYLKVDARLDHNVGVVVLNARPLYWDAEMRRWEFPYDYSTWHRDLTGLVIHAQGNVTEDCLVGDLYALEVQVQAGTVTLAQAERVVKTLRKVDRYLEKSIEKQGRPVDYPNLVGRVALALGAKGILHPKDYRANVSYSSDTLGQDINNLRYQLELASREDSGVQAMAHYLDVGQWKKVGV